MPPIRDRIEFHNISNDTLAYHHFSKRVNLNPLHYATLPLKNGWNKVSPALSTYKDYTRIISIFLGGLSMLVMLDNHKWKLPRWPWAKDGKLHPKPSYQHRNERMTVDELAQKKITEMLREMKMHEGEDIPWEVSPGSDDEDIAAQEAEEQFMEDEEAAVGEVVDELEMEGAIG
jgi:hypothetical protein